LIARSARRQRVHLSKFRHCVTPSDASASIRTPSLGTATGAVYNRSC
jgi:hypothetical protein